MNTQMVSTTDIQRNFKAVLTRLISEKNPLIVLRDSIPTAVMLSVEEYERLTNLEHQLLSEKMKAILAELSSKNAKISDDELNKDISIASHAKGDR